MSTIEHRLNELGIVLPASLQLPPGARLPFPWVRVVGQRALISVHGPTEVDGTLAQHFPLFGGLAGVGVNGFWYDQITGDSGSGATYGDFKGRTTGLGPVLSYAFKVGKLDMIAEAKWLHELDTTKRLEGDIVWFKLVAKF